MVGIFQSFSVFENGAVFMPLAEMPALINRPHRVTGFLVLSDKPGDAAAAADLRRRIEALDPALAATPTGGFCREHQPDSRRPGPPLGSLRPSPVHGPDRHHEHDAHFGFRADSGDRRPPGDRLKKPRVVRMVVYETTLLVLAGAVAGCLGGGLLLQGLARLPQTASVVDGHLPVAVVIQAMNIDARRRLDRTPAYPAWWATRRQPVEAVRHV